jgi:hypothetical protein
MVGGHGVLFATCLVKPEPGSLSLRGLILERHGDDCMDSGESEEHDGEDSAAQNTSKNTSLSRGAGIDEACRARR